MFGNHAFEVALRIANEKSIELGKECIPIPNDDGTWTIGVPIKALTGAEFKKKLLGQ